MTFDTSLVSKNTSHYGDFTFLLGAYNYKPFSSKGKSILRGPKEVFLKVECIYSGHLVRKYYKPPLFRAGLSETEILCATNF